MEGRLLAESSTAATFEGAEAPDEDEIEFYHQLERRGWRCGVHDPDFAAPLEGTLHLERGLRYMLRLECEDESLSVEARKVTDIRVELRDDVGNGCGVALVDASGSGSGPGAVVSLLIADCEEDRSQLARVIGRLREDPRAFRRVRKRSLLGCLPTCAGALPACANPRARRPASAPPAGAAAPSGLLRGRSASTSSSRASGKAAPSVRTAALDQVRAHVQGLWEKSLRMAASTRSSSFGAMAIANMRRASAVSKASDYPEGPGRGRSSDAGLTPTKASDRLDATSCAALLNRLLRAEEPGGQDSSDLSSLADLFGQTGEGAGVTFPEFWEVFVGMLLVFILWTEPVLQKYLREGSAAGMTLDLEQWEWFLVQVQDEETAAVEAAEAQLSGLRVPDVDAAGRMTLVGLSKYLCSPGNSIFRPKRCEMHQDMTRPLAEYWISSAHHVYADPPASAQAMTAGCGDSCGSDDAGALPCPVGTAIRSGCRCLGLAVVLGSDGGLCVLLQQRRVPLPDVLRAIDASAFERTRLPLLLVLHLGLLPLASCAGVPGALSEALGPRLWRPAAGLPSPEEAAGRGVVVLAPAVGGDPALEAELPPALRGGRAAAGASSSVPPETQAEAEAEAEALRAWQAASRDFAVWLGQPFGCEPCPEAQVSFIACDELQALDEAGQRQLAEHTRGALVLVYPLAPRCAPANFNVAGAWSVGAQMAALTIDAGGGDAAALAHAGRFGQENGGCGYVLKPPHLRRGEEGLDPEAARPSPVRLELRVLAARAVQSTGPVAVSLAVWGAPGDCARRAYRPVRPVGPALVWPEAAAGDGAAPKPLEFLVASPCTALLVVELLEPESREGGTRRLGFFAAPVDGLRQGLRWVPLWTRGRGGEVSQTGRGPFAGLLVHVAVARLRRA